MVALWGTTLALSWWFLAPAQLGGTTAYVMVTGTSMLPDYEPGDLILVREQSAYEPGDAIAYRDPIGYVVFHRAVDRSGRRLVMQGDNNPTPDLTRPLPDDIVGAEWMHVGGGGFWMSWARRPEVAGALFSALGLWIGMGLVAGRRDVPSPVGSETPETKR